MVKENLMHMTATRAREVAEEAGYFTEMDLWGGILKACRGGSMWLELRSEATRGPSGISPEDIDELLDKGFDISYVSPWYTISWENPTRPGRMTVGEYE